MRSRHSSSKTTFSRWSSATEGAIFIFGVRLGFCTPIMGQPPLDGYIPVLAPPKTALPSRRPLPPPYISLGLRHCLVRDDVEFDMLVGQLVFILQDTEQAIRFCDLIVFNPQEAQVTTDVFRSDK